VRKRRQTRNRRVFVAAAASKARVRRDGRSHDQLKLCSTFRNNRKLNSTEITLRADVNFSFLVFVRDY
jgi:hypothetical protein